MNDYSVILVSNPSVGVLEGLQIHLVKAANRIDAIWQATDSGDDALLVVAVLEGHIKEVVPGTLEHNSILL